jgi:hypothetical protein
MRHQSNNTIQRIWKRNSLIVLFVFIIALLIQGYIIFAASNDSYTESLLHFDGTSGATTFIDEGGGIWTPYGNTQLDSTKSKFGGTSGFFDGSGDYLKTTMNSSLSLGRQDFTIDFWVNLNQLPTGNAYNSGQYIVSSGPNYADYGLDFILGSSLIRFNLGYYSAVTVSANWTPEIATWYHIAVVRSGNVFRIFLNGTQIGQNTVDVAMPDFTSYNFAIGRCEPDGESTGYLNGWLEEFRISKGIARWTADFTPPIDAYDPIPIPTMLPLPGYGVDDSYTKVLHHFYGQDGDTGFDDESGKFWTSIGNPEVDTDQSKFGGSSINFDGNSTCLKTLYNADFDIGSGDFTMEAWFNSRSFNSGQIIFSKDTYGSNYDWGMLILNSTTLAVYSNGTGWQFVVTVPAMSTATWYHFAFVRYNGVLTIYLNGVSYGTSTMGITNASQSYVTLGCSGWNNPNAFFNGFIDEARFSKGIARYTGNFTPSTTEFLPVPPNPTLIPVPTSIPGLDDSSSNVLLHFNGRNNSTIFTDESGKNWTPRGNSKIHTTQYKFGGASGMFDGSSDYISTPYSTDFDFGNGDFTIDLWAYFTNPRKGYEMIASHRLNGGTNGWVFYIENNSALQFIADADGGGGWDFVIPTGFYPEANTWTHLAAVRHGNDWNVYVNGISVAHIVNGGTIMDLNVPLYIGSDPTYGTNYNFEGYLDELRISKGVARWTSDFTPSNMEYLPPVPTVTPTIVPTVIPGIDDEYTKSLLHLDGANNSTTFIDESGKIWVPTGESKIDTSQSQFGGASGYFDGSGDGVSTSVSSDFSFGADDFTLEARVRLISYPSVKSSVISIVDGTGDYEVRLEISSYGTVRFVIYHTGTYQVEFGSDITLSLNSWYHIAAVRHGLTHTIYINGVNTNYINKSHTITTDRDWYAAIGVLPAFGILHYPYLGNIDEVRISKGIARWTSNFITPTAAYEPEPSITNLQINGGSSSIDLTASSTANVICSFSVTDASGYTNIQYTTAKLYRSGVGVDAVNDINNHYTLSGDSECIPSNGFGTSEDYICTFQVYYLADPTDVGSDYSSDDWSCTATATGIHETGNPVTVSTEMNSLIALDVTSSLDYGAINPGTNTGNSNSTIIVSNMGNSSMDLNILGSDMCTDHPTCTGSILEVENQEYSISPFTYGTGTILTTLNQFLDVNISKPTENPSNSTLNLYWGLSIPGGQNNGTYTGQNTISGVSN